MLAAGPFVLAGLLLTIPVCATGTPLQNPQPLPAEPQLPVIKNVRIEGASVYTADEIARRHRLAPGARLPKAPPDIARDIERRYRNDGYTFAEATATFDETTGELAIVVQEGHIDEIEFRGVSGEIADRLRDEFGVKTGDVFNRPQASRALDEALQVAQGAIVRSGRERTFEMIVDNGRRVLQINLRTRSQRSGVFVGTQGREDWYSPVDGFAPAIGFQSTIFDRKRFNHTYWAGYVSYKTGPERAGYSFGFERPFFGEGILQAGASVHDVTASDDQWRLTTIEQSLVAFGFRNSFRDYYRRKGFQLYAAVRPLAQHEWLVAWRQEEHGALVNETDWGLFRDEHSYRPNRLAQPGDLRALLIGYTFDSRGLTRESPGERYRRHQADDLFGSSSEQDHGARVEWRSEVAPASFEHDFDFTRHVLNARGWVEMAPGRLLSARVVTGGSSGTLPQQRLFALGGIGSVHGYRFKEAMGERMLLLNGEVRQRLGRSGRSGISGLAFIDAGRVFRPVAGSSEEWLKGVGVGLGFGSSARLEFGWRLDDIPKSLQVLFRLTPTF
jgi:hypothetical protein